MFYGEFVGHTRDEVHYYAQAVVVGQALDGEIVAQRVDVVYGRALSRVFLAHGVPLYDAVVQHKVHLVGAEHRE